MPRMVDESSQSLKQYREHLSPLGQGVLTVMLQQWKKEREVNLRPRHRILLPPPQIRERRILSFNPEPDVPFMASTPTLREPLVSPSRCDRDKDTSFTLTGLFDIDTEPTQLESTPAISEDPKALTKSVDEEANNHIDWDNMFDSDVLPQIPVENNLKQVDDKLEIQDRTKIKKGKVVRSRKNKRWVPKKGGVIITSEILITPEMMKDMAAKRKCDANVKGRED